METTLRNAQNLFNRQLLIELISYAFILLMLYAALYKLFDYQLFIRQLEKSPVVGPHKEILAWLVPLAEIVISIFLFIKNWRMIGLIGATALMSIFTIYVAYILFAAPHIPCSCGGIIATMGWKAHLFFNSGFVILGGIGIWLQRNSKN